MGEEKEPELPVGRRHIIERPRLTRLLDETSARVIMLVAPAGYGKTTLARQWLANREHVWYQATPASADVAALAAGIADSLARVVPNANETLRERLRATIDATQEVAVLAEVQAEALGAWAEDGWLAIDDYQFLAGSQPAESYFDILLKATPVRLLLTSRVRPAWATARRLLYGEIYELGRTPLAMNETEAEGVFSELTRDRLPGLVALADGWPAVIGLAALTDADVGDEALPAALYDYFAEELYQAATVPIRRGLLQLAVPPMPTADVVISLLGRRRGERLIAEGHRLGFLAGTGEDVSLHPLLRTFLLRKVNESDRQLSIATARAVSEYLLENGRWDDASALVNDHHLPELLVPLVQRAYDDMLRAGRLKTLEEWLQIATHLRIRLPILDIVRAELAMRRGELGQAEALATRVERRATTNELRTRALCIAGQAAHLDNREGDAHSHYERAQRLAEDAEARRSAVWGRLISAQALGRDEELREILAELLTEEPETADDVLRVANAQLSVGSRLGGISVALEAAQTASSVISEADDPLVRTSFLNIFGRTLSLVARYDEAARIAEEEVEDAKRSHLTFVIPHAHVAKAIAEVGLRRFGDAETSLSRAQKIAQEIDDVHNLVDAQTVRCKLAISAGDAERAIALGNRIFSEALPTLDMVGEHKATRALALACARRSNEALAATRQAEELTSLLEVGALVACARAVVSIDSSAALEQSFDEALGSIFSHGVVDPFVIAYRGRQELLLRSLSSELHREPVLRVLADAQDLALARPAGVDVKARSGVAGLSPREAEVLDLLTLGYTNRQIANALYIAEVTAKVHVRRILQKLGVRSRTEAALVALRQTNDLPSSGGVADD